jgi:hypothetical protein
LGALFLEHSMRLRPLLVAVLLAPVPAFADEFDSRPSLSVEDKATLNVDRDEAHKKIDEKYKDDDSPEAKRAKRAEYDQADQDLLEKRGMSQKDYLWQNSHNSPDEQREIKTKTTEIAEKRKADREAAEKAKAAPAEPEVVKGFDDKHPLDMSEGAEKPKPAEKPQLDADGNPLPAVEKLSPEDEAASGSGSAAAEEPAPRKHRGKRRGGE